MRMSRLFAKTLRQAPAEAESAGHKLLLRASIATPLAAGVYAYLPLGWKVVKRIEEIVRQEMDACGGQEMMMPALLPIDFYEQSGRDKTMADILFRLKDHHGREFALGPTHEEIFVEVFKRNVQSYRDLPVILYQIATKFRDEPRPRGGLIRLRQFIMKDAYSFDADWEGLDRSYQLMFDAYKRIFDRCGVPTIPALADAGAMGGKDTHEFLYLTDVGEDTCLLCPNCGYAANAEVAAFVKEPAHADTDPLPLEEIDTPGQKTIADLAKFLGMPETQTCKAVFYVAKVAGEEGATIDVPVFVAIRGDMEVNDAKLRAALRAVELRPMDEADVRKYGIVAGSASPVGVSFRDLERERLRIVADDLVTKERNLVAGANKPDKHLRNTNYGRDWTADIVADIALARSGKLCANCRTPMEARRGVEMGQVFKLGTRYSEMMGALFLDAEGKQQPAIMGSYGIGMERIVAAVIEEHHDENGIIWPKEVAPFQVHIVAIQPDKPGVRETADRLYDELHAAGLEPLYDDRDETPGVKFNDADLLGMPLRVTVSPRNLDKGSLEVRPRTATENELIPLEGAVDAIRARLA
ncbi:MAG TPA: proline--tRNA ligase [Dehalococcoidia bacterium]